MDRAHLLLQHWLDTNSLGRDGRLPPERTLATEFGVTRAEIRKALAILEADGRLVRHVGRGTFLVGPGRIATGPKPADPSSRADPGLADPGLAEVTSPRQALEACLAIEPVLAASASLNGTAGQMRTIAAAAEAVGAAETWDSYDAADTAFHRSIAEGAGTPLLLALHDLVMRTRSALAWGVLRQRESVPTPLHPSIAEHGAIVAALASRDQHAAFGATRHHLLVEAAAILGHFP